MLEKLAIKLDDIQIDVKRLKAKNNLLLTSLWLLNKTKNPSKRLVITISMVIVESKLIILSEDYKK